MNLLEQAQAFIGTADIFAGGEPNTTVAKWMGRELLERVSDSHNPFRIAAVETIAEQLIESGKEQGNDA